MLICDITALINTLEEKFIIRLHTKRLEVTKLPSSQQYMAVSHTRFYAIKQRKRKKKPKHLIYFATKFKGKKLGSFFKQYSKSGSLLLKWLSLGKRAGGGLWVLFDFQDTFDISVTVSPGMWLPLRKERWGDPLLGVH